MVAVAGLLCDIYLSNDVTVLLMQPLLLLAIQRTSSVALRYALTSIRTPLACL